MLLSKIRISWKVGLQALPDTDKEVRARLEQLKTELNPLQAQKEVIDNHAHRLFPILLCLVVNRQLDQRWTEFCWPLLGQDFQDCAVGRPGRHGWAVDAVCQAHLLGAQLVSCLLF